MNRTLVCASLLLASCGGEPISLAKPAPIRWTYQAVHVSGSDPDEYSRFLNDASRNGWELAQIVGAMIVVKRASP